MPAAPDPAGESTQGGWRQSDVRRAIAAAEKAGLTSYRVEIAPDGTISIVVGMPSDPSQA
jgi:hypothetical protein